MAFRTNTENSDLFLILLGIKAARISYECRTSQTTE
jgi:hypothetical protein